MIHHVRHEMEDRTRVRRTAREVRERDRRELGRALPEQDVAPWSSALRELLSNRESYERCALRSRDVARRYVSTIRVSDFEEMLWDCDRQAAPHPA